MSNGTEEHSPPVRPPLSRDRWATLEPLIDVALELPREQRPAYLDDACGADASLRAELERLLTEYDRRDTLLDHPAAERFASLLDEVPVRLPAVLSDRYRIEREIGRGGMATVYLAHDVRHEREVAVKVLHPQLAAAVGAERFLAEIRTTAQLQHPHILALYDSGGADGILFYVMPYVEGESLRQRMNREQQLPVADAVRIASEVASALDAAHRQGVIHRDIKPENILLQDGAALVADFGIALAVRAAATPRLTSPGLTVGTPQYMSPEQASGERAIDSRTDVYSLGAVLYEMLAGEPPFTGPTTTAVIAKLVALPAPSLRIVRAAVPAAVEAAVARALAREAADRYRTAGDFSEALRQALIVPSASGEHPPQPAAQGVRHRLGLSLLGLLMVAITATVVALVVGGSRRTDPLENRVLTIDGMKSIAVVPLAIVGTDTADRYFAEGMTDELSGALGRVPGLRVVSGRSAAFLANGKAPDVTDLGRKLGVATLLQGRARREGTERKIAIELVSTRDGSTLWTNSYTRDVRAAKDVYAVRDRIVRDIVSQLRVTLSDASAATPIRHPTENLKAYDLYQQGQYFLDQRTQGSAAKALRYFQQAIEIDSTFTEAYSGVSDVYTVYGIGNVGDYPPNEYFPKARVAAERALALDSTSSGAHEALGSVAFLYDFDWARGERELGRAIELDPRSSTAHTNRTSLLEFEGRFDDAIAEARVGVQMVPFSMFANTEMGRALFFAKRYEPAIAELSQVLERDPTQYRAHLLLGEVFEQNGMLDSAVVEMQKAVRLLPKSSRTHAFLAHAYARAGRTGDALRELGTLQQRARSGAYVPAFDLAVVYAGLGRKDEMFEWLEKALEEHSLRPYLMDPTFDPIKSDPRFQQLLRKLHLPLATPRS